MKNTVTKYIDRLKRDRARRNRAAAVLVCLSVIVATGTAWALHMTGESQTGQAYCGYEEHTHTEDCIGESVLICGYNLSDTDEAESDASAAHTHTDECYEITYTCGKEEHIHSLACYSNPEADVETKENWETTVENVELSGDYAGDLVAIAKSQLGYEESKSNYEALLDGEGNETGEVRGYTRYGAWYGDDYADWDALFVSFSLSYAGVPEKLFPQSALASEWVEILSSETYSLYHPAASGYYPEAGDLVFFDDDGNGSADRVGIVSERIPVPEGETVTNSSGDPLASVSFKTIEGDSGDRVAEGTYEYTDLSISGYASMNLWGNMDDDERVAYVNGLIAHLSFEEAQAALEAYEDAGDDDGYAAYYEALKSRVDAAQMLYYELTEEQRAEVIGADTLQSWVEMFSVQPLATATAVVVSRRNAGIGQYTTPMLLCTSESGKTVKDVCKTEDGWTYWTEIVIKKDSSGNLKVNSVNASAENKSGDSVPVNTEGFILMIYGTYTGASVGSYVICSNDRLWQNTTSSTNLNGTIVFSDTATAGDKEAKDNSSELHVVQGVDTSSFITMNLYDYGDEINTKYNSNNDYPGFQQDYGAGTTISSGSSLNFGNNITSDLLAGNGSVTSNAAEGSINKVPNANLPTSINGDKAYSSPMSMTLGTDGYPQSSGNISWKYLFNDDPDNGVTQVNTENITGLFQYDPDTGFYSFNSRQNHAQFDASTNSFVLYKETITSNFIFYPFGNFLPFNDIVTEAKNSSEIDATYLKTIADSASAKAELYDSLYTTIGKTPYATLATSLNNFLTWAQTGLGSNWTAAEATNKFLSDSNTGSKGVTKDDLSKLYTIDYDEATDFYFGMTLEMDFVQSKGGVTSKGQDMILRFTGDDDVLFYIDGVLFLDLSGIHRHVGGEIDFKKGEVRYYALDATTGDVATSAESGTAVLTRTFSDILKEAGKSTAAATLVNGTFADYTNHTVNWYYMERGSGSGVCRLEFNMEQVAPTAINKVDQYGDSVPGATFAVYPATEDYSYKTALNGDAINSTVSSVDSETGVITFEDGTTLEPLFIGTTDSTGQVIFTDSEGKTMSLASMKQNFGENFILREVKVPDGYRTVADESWMYFYGDALLCANTLASGTWASPDMTVMAPETLYKADATEEEEIAYYTHDTSGNVIEQKGTLFAVVLKKNAANDKDYDKWYPVTGNDKEGYVVSTTNGVEAAIAAAKTYTDDVTKTNNHVFSVGVMNLDDDGKTEATIGMMVTIEEMPGFPTSYYTWLDDYESDNEDEGEGVDTAEYLVAYYYSTAESLEDATEVNTYRVASHNSTTPDGAAAFTVQWTSTIEIPDVINTLYFQKADESVSTLIDDAVFALYEVEAGNDVVDGESHEYGYYVAVDEDGTKAYVRLDRDKDDNKVYGKATVYSLPGNGSTGTEGSYTVATDLTIPVTDGTGYIEDDGAGVITVIADGKTYTITPAKNAYGQSLVGYTHDVCDTINEDGTGHFKYLKSGYYFLKEIAAPAGYILNSTNVMVAVNDDGVYASAGTVDDGVRVGNGPGYLVKTLDVFASIGHIDETFSWIYSVLKVDDEHDVCFEGLGNLEKETSLGINDVSYPLYQDNVTSGDESALTVNGDPYAENADVMVIYQQYDGSSNVDGSGHDSIFDYIAVTEDERTSTFGVSSEVKWKTGSDMLRLWTESGWSDLAIFQDTTYGQVKTDESTVYTKIEGDIAHLFSSSTFVQVSDTVNIDLTVTKVTDDFYADENDNTTTTIYLDDAEFTLTRYVEVDDEGNVETIVDRETAVDEDGTVKSGYKMQYYDGDDDSWVDSSKTLTTKTTFVESDGTTKDVTTTVYVTEAGDGKSVYVKVFTINNQTYTLSSITNGTATLTPVTVTKDEGTGVTTVTESQGANLTGTLARSFFKIRGLSQGTYYLNETKVPTYTTATGGPLSFGKLSETVIKISDGKYYYYEENGNKIIVDGEEVKEDSTGHYIMLIVNGEENRTTVYEGNSFSVSISGDDASYLVELDNSGTTAAYYEDVTETVQMGFRVNNTAQEYKAEVQLVKVNADKTETGSAPGYNEGGTQFTVSEDTTYTAYNVLAGAEFKLYRISYVEGGEEEVKLYYKLNSDGTADVDENEANATVLKVDEKGYLNITGLNYNYTYYLVETKAPAGFDLLTEPVEISWTSGVLSVSGAGATVQQVGEGEEQEVYIVIYNEGGYTLPMTGGEGTISFIAFGLVFIAVSAACMFLLRRKRGSRVR